MSASIYQKMWSESSGVEIPLWQIVQSIAEVFVSEKIARDAIAADAKELQKLELESDRRSLFVSKIVSYSFVSTAKKLKISARVCMDAAIARFLEDQSFQSQVLAAIGKAQYDQAISVLNKSHQRDVLNLKTKNIG